MAPLSSHAGGQTPLEALRRRTEIPTGEKAPNPLPMWEKETSQGHEAFVELDWSFRYGLPSPPPPVGPVASRGMDLKRVRKPGRRPEAGQVPF